MTPINFTPQALTRWESVPGETRQRLLRNGWCVHCSKEVTITQVTGRIQRGDLVLTGQCNECQGEAGRVIEGGEGAQQHQSAAAFLAHALLATYRT